LRVGELLREEVEIGLDKFTTLNILESFQLEGEKKGGEGGEGGGGERES